MRVLITVLGRGQFNKELGKYDYQTANYELPDGSIYTTKLVGGALKSYLNPDKVYVVGTSKSLWELADELIGDYEKVKIPFGISSEEFWEMFRMLSELDVKGKEVYLDITHGFRSIPLFISTLVNLFTKVKGARVKGIYYGIWEAKYEKGGKQITPVVDLMPLIKLGDWIEGFTLFAHYGDGQYLEEIIKSAISDLPVKSKKNLGRVNSLPKVLTKYSHALGFTAPTEIVNSLQKLGSIFSSINPQDLPAGFEPIIFLKEAFIGEAQKFKDITREWEKQLHIAEWLFEKKRYTQSVITLEESIFTYVMEGLSIDPLDKRKRLKLSGLFKEDRKEHKLFSRELHALFGKVQELRNKAGHAFMNKEVSEKDFTESIKKLREYIDNAFNTLKGNHLLNREAILERLGGG